MKTSVTRPAELHADELTLTAASPLPFIPTLVALNKHLLLSQQTVPVAGQWLFTGLQLSRFPVPNGALHLKISRLLPGIAARTTFSSGEEPLGTIEFVWHRQSLHSPPPV